MVSAWTKVPVQKLAESDADRLKKLESVLHKRVVGQEEAVQRGGAGSQEEGRVGPERTRGARSVHFCSWGPTGVGKRPSCPKLWQRHCSEAKNP